LSESEGKRKAAAAALAMVSDGMVLGLGSGSTVAVFLQLLSQRIAEGLRIRGVPTSLRTAETARRSGIPLVEPTPSITMDLDVDGADEVAPDLTLIKGLGGALAREKIVAAAAQRVVIIVDDSKLVQSLGSRVPVPVEVLPFGWELAADKLRRLGAVPRLRRRGSAPFLSDNGNHIIDCRFEAITTPRELGREMDSVPGVVEHGLFCDLADMVLVGGEDGVRTLQCDKSG